MLESLGESEGSGLTPSITGWTTKRSTLKFLLTAIRDNAMVVCVCVGICVLRGDGFGLGYACMDYGGRFVMKLNTW